MSEGLNCKVGFKLQPPWPPPPKKKQYANIQLATSYTTTNTNGRQ